MTRRRARVSRAAPLLSLLLLAGCLSSVAPSDFTTGAVEIDCCGEGEAVELHYLGVGGWSIRSPHGHLLTAPLFSNPGVLETGLTPIAADTLRILEGLRYVGAPPLDDVDAILVGHAHYDHLLDVPWIAARLAPRATVLGSRTARIQAVPAALALGMDPARIVAVEESAADLRTPGRWIDAGPGFRVLPLHSDHAPHYSDIVLYEGRREVPMVEAPPAADDWLDGETFAWLIDVLDGEGRTSMRIYYQDAVARAPAGEVPPPEVLGDSIPVDVAILVPATWASVDWHPEAVLESADPSHVLLGHWEDFFRPVTAPADPVRFTWLPGFLARLRRWTDCGDACWDLPEPGTRFRFRAKVPGDAASPQRAP